MKIIITVISLLLLGSLSAHSPSSNATENLSLAIGDNFLNVDYPDDFSSKNRQKLSVWLDSVANSITQVYGSLPLPTTYIEIKSYQPRKGYSKQSPSPVPWAYVNRGEKSGVSFHVNTALSLEEFITDWTAYHELSHLFIPFPGTDDIWFSEGLASYYQNITRARSAVISEQQAWQALYDGFIRGSKDNRESQLSLKELSPRMREKHSFMRVYWSGAYYFLITDIALRTQTNHRQSLDTVLYAFKQCCLNSNKEWTGREIANKFDELSQTKIFSNQFTHSINSYQLAGFEESLASIGLSINNQRIELSTETKPFHSKIMGTSL